ncbi:MAG: ParB N-terminal domain-containing protein [Lachnospiraceae bacterium]|nr:ParB N-terminal domain-containing protein [Lachnospiraceae bacterium]
MTSSNSALFRRVLDDAERYKNRRKIVRAGIIERLLVRKVEPDKLHVNPKDEFTHIGVGPSERIVEDYCKDVRFYQRHGGDIFPEPIIVEKMQEDGYLILNGHHRWAAAIKMMVPKVRVVIVNQ